MSAPGRVIIGTSGWRYSSWRGSFYPRSLVQRRELEYLSGELSSVEINGSFYSLQSAASYQRWHNETHLDFLFSVKGGRFITHMLRMRRVHTALANFFASGPLLLDEKLGPFLWQLPERETFDAAVLDEFCDQLPKTIQAARRLAADHDDKVPDVAAPVEGGDGAIRHALEVRHPSFVAEESFAILRHHNVALVIADTAGRWPAITDITADFIYVRLHGSQELYTSGYTPAELQEWAQSAVDWTTGTGCPDSQPRDVYIYFDNDAKAYAPLDARNLATFVRDVSQTTD